MFYHFENKNYQRSFEISESITKMEKDSDVILVAAKSSFYLQKYDTCINLFKQIPLNNNSKLMLASAYARTDNKIKSIEILKEIIGDQSIKKEAEKDPMLKNYVEEIEKAEAERIKQSQSIINTPGVVEQ